MKKPFRRLELVLDYGNTAREFLQNKNLENWQQDLQLRYAVAHALSGVVENVKEYAQAIGLPELTEKYPNIPWKLIIRFRDKMTHHYEVLNQDALYEFATMQLPELLDVVKKIIGDTAPRQGHGFVPEDKRQR